MFTKFVVIDGFLGPEFAAELLEFAQAGEAAFGPAGVTTAKLARGVDRQARHSFSYEGKLGALGKKFRQSISTRLDEFLGLAGLEKFASPKIELGMVANRDGGFFCKHIDTFTDSTRKHTNTDRVLSAVYYFNNEPAVFSGGELALYPIASDSDPTIIEARHDRLVLFPSFAPHEVLPITLPGNKFADARFSINCWIRRVRS